MRVLKFGGSSLATPRRIRAVSRIVVETARRERVVVVVSALQAVTDQLLEAARTAERGDENWMRAHRALARRHLEMARRLCPAAGGAALRRRIEARLDELRDVLRGIRLLRHAPPRALDHVASFGELLSSELVAAHLGRMRRAEAVDARELVVTDDRFTEAVVRFGPTNANLRRRLGPAVRSGSRAPIPVVTGFIGATSDGRTTTIGRNGSDYSAAIFGAALRASRVEIWTDVDGILSADPTAVRAAFVIERLSYEEAMELSYFGAKVLHSAALAPAVAKRIPILIKNTLRPAAPGTLISDRAATSQPVAKGITSIDGMALLTLRGLRMVGVPGTAERLFRALAQEDVSVILISQASSEHTICFAIRETDVVRARGAIRHEFRYEFQNGTTTLDEAADCSIAAIVGEGMKGTPGVAGRLFESLGRNGISIAAIAQGASERNISFVVPTADKVRTLRVVHEAFFERRRKLMLVVVGTGNIGAALLRQLQRQRHYLLARGFDVRVGAICNRRGCVLDAEGIDLARWRETLSASRAPRAPAALMEAIAGFQWTNAALVDCTASTQIVDAYTDFVRANLHIVTPNKQANVLPLKRYQTLNETLRERRKHFLYEANVGAGLPIISTLQDLIASGDTVERIEGIFSGTLAYLFNDATAPFSARVREAHGLGFTEPDPREDLSGRDVARKLLVLARLTGHDFELRDVAVENLVPRPLRPAAFRPTFFSRLAKWDEAMEERRGGERRRGRVLRYAGFLHAGRAFAGLGEYPAGHPLASGRRNDNVITFTTRRYAKTPLVVQGPGAGADVTAMGVFSDILKLLHYLPA
jgi:bifunctional aspartokinase / homoserine dehydrogenase 1